MDENTATPVETPEKPKPQDEVDKLRALGIDPNKFVTTFIIPIVDQIEEQRAKAFDAKITRIIEDASAKASQRANESFMEQLNKQLASAGSPPVPDNTPTAQQQPAQEVLPAPRGGGAFEQLIPVILQYFMKSGSGAGAADGGRGITDE